MRRGALATVVDVPLGVEIKVPGAAVVDVEVARVVEVVDNARVVEVVLPKGSVEVVDAGGDVEVVEAGTDVDVLDVEVLDVDVSLVDVVVSKVIRLPPRATTLPLVALVASGIRNDG